MCLLRGTFYILRSAHIVYLCVLCGSENKQRLFHCTALTDWLVFITEMECVYCAVRTGCLYIISAFQCLTPSACTSQSTHSGQFSAFPEKCNVSQEHALSPMPLTVQFRSAL